MNTTTIDRIHTGRVPITGMNPRITIPLGDLDVSELDARHSGTARRNWRRPAPTTSHSRRQDTNAGRYSSRCAYTKWEHQLLVESWCEISTDGKTLAWSIDVGRGANHGVRTGRMTAPKGWIFAPDGGRPYYGFSLRKISNPDCDYHPTAGAVIDGETPREWAQIATRNAKVRRENARAYAALQRENRALAARVIRDNPLVMLQDSIRAGNCGAGTVRFAEAAGIAADRHYSAIRANRLRPVAARTGQTARLEPAIVAAWQRENLVSI